MALELSRQALLAHRKALLWWVVGVAALCLITMAFYPVMADNPELNSAFDDASPAMQALIGETDLVTPAGYLQSQLFFSTVPILMLVYAVSRASALTGGDERRGLLELVVTLPIARRWVLGQRWLAVAAGVLALAVTIALTTFVGARIVDMRIHAWAIVHASVSALLIGLLFCGLTFFIGGATGKRGLTAGVASAYGVGSFLGYSLLPLSDTWGWLARFTAWYYYADAEPLRNGMDPLHALVLIAATAGFVVYGAVLFERRDVGS